MSTHKPIEFGILLNLAFGSFKERLHEHLAGKGFDDLGPSFGYVFRLLEAGPHSLREVADLLQITPQGALKIVNEMVAKGYVQRGEDERDGRTKPLCLTDRSIALLRAARGFHKQFEADFVKRVGESQAAAARAVLEDIASQGGSVDLRRLRPL
ncbi:MarR family winged helix-turn-helix transcriptional regulator [Paraburkholderia sp. D15]|uniref:MarR family winged helix-turn-helix transcriptional regulator n=1 Tax=Paraburkholderia sp. D15 TaxID=2880218 RepID=UPI0024784474|nr:MarR family winged helix-turn-helix transcriptional regulator [Paraburkholderia sp. D15]WGS53885.1 MarR family winged helix-turn-helix transcriptional regulator [Paraburkholderia sp. D15]